VVFSVMRIWAKITAFGMLIVSILLAVFVLADVTLHLGWGYRPVDLLIPLAVALIGFLVFGVVKHATRKIEHHGR